MSRGEKILALMMFLLVGAGGFSGGALWAGKQCPPAEIIVDCREMCPCPGCPDCPECERCEQCVCPECPPPCPEPEVDIRVIPHEPPEATQPASYRHYLIPTFSSDGDAREAYGVEYLYNWRRRWKPMVGVEWLDDPFRVERWNYCESDVVEQQDWRWRVGLAIGFGPQ